MSGNVDQVLSAFYRTNKCYLERTLATITICNLIDQI